MGMRSFRSGGVGEEANGMAALAEEVEERQAECVAGDTGLAAGGRCRVLRQSHWWRVSVVAGTGR